MTKEIKEAVNKKYDGKIAELKKKKAEELKKKTALFNKQENIKKQNLRKEQTRIKIILGGYLMAQFKNKQIQKEKLNDVIKTLKIERDKKLITELLSTLA